MKNIFRIIVSLGILGLFFSSARAGAYSFSWHPAENGSAAVQWMQPGTAPPNPLDYFWFDSNNNFNVSGGVVAQTAAIGTNAITVNNLAQLIANANFAGTVYLTAPVTLTGPLTTTCDLRPVNGAVINTNGYTLTINGPFHAGNYQCFAGTTPPVFAAGSTPSLSDQWFGVLHDSNGTTGSGTDNTATLTEAMNVAAASGIRLELGSGIIRCASMVAITLSGSEQLFVDGKAEIFFDIPFATISYGLSVTGSSNPFRLTGITLDRTNEGSSTPAGEGIQNSLLYLLGLNNFEISGITVTGGMGHLITTYECTNGTISNCFLHDGAPVSGCDGLHLEYGCTNIKIIGNWVWNTGDDSISLYEDTILSTPIPISNIIIANNNVFESNPASSTVNAWGIKIGVGSEYVRCYANYVHDMPDHNGIEVLANGGAPAYNPNLGVSDVQIYDNTIYNVENPSPLFGSGYGLEVAYNTIPYGISNVQIKNNEIIECGQAMYLVACGVAGIGIFNTTIENNKIDSCASGLTVASNDSGSSPFSNALIEGNTISNISSGDAIYGSYATNLKIIGNIVINANATGIGADYDQGLYIIISRNFVKGWNADGLGYAAIRTAGASSTTALIALDNMTSSPTGTSPGYDFSGITPKSEVDRNMTDSATASILPTGGSYSTNPFIVF